MSKNVKRWLALVLLVSLLLTLVFVGQGLAKDKLKTAEQLGEFLYFDEDLSEPAGQSCASCHLPEAGFVDPDSDLPVSEGVIPGLFGGRNSPASAYAMYAPVRFIDGDGLYVGGQFWDSRATGLVRGDPLADQALGPFLNPVEMANPDMATVVKDVRRSSYANLFKEVCGKVKFDDPASVEAAYNCIADSIAAFERTELFGQFSSKYDVYLEACLVVGGLPDDCAKGIGQEAALAGAATLSPDEWSGLQLFMDEGDDGAKCVLCHVADWTAVDDDELPVVKPLWTAGTAAEDMIPPMFTDFTYDNLGVPVNPEIADLIGEPQPIDLGLGAIVDNEEENGKFKVMTLRNIGLTAPYAHNGFFGTLDEITHFYNTRDVEVWPEPEYPDTVNFDELGDLGLTADEEALLVAFMKTLSDGYVP